MNYFTCAILAVVGALAAAPGYAELVIVPASGHGTFTTRADLVNLAIREFLDQPPDSTVPAH